MKAGVSSIVPIAPGGASEALALKSVWNDDGGKVLGPGGTAATVAHLGERSVLVVYDRTTEKAAAYELKASSPWITRLDASIALPGGPWDQLETFVMGNAKFLLTYRTDKGIFAVFHLRNDLSLSAPYTFDFPRNWPTAGFTTVKPFAQGGNQYVLGYGKDDGKVGIYSITTTTSSKGNVPALLGQNVWFHTWARGWQRFAFFQLGSGTFFFKINVDKLNVNIDHVNDNPSTGTVEVGSNLQDQLPEAASVDVAAIVPWSRGEPYLLTYVAAKDAAEVYRIHHDCLGWTHVGGAKVNGASLVVPYRVDSGSFALFHGGSR